MQKYWQLLKLTWQNGLVYRTSLFLWRLRQFLSSLMSLTIWSVIFAGTSSAFGYSQPEMITYIFLAAFLQSMIRATALHSLGSRIYSGEITNQLLKPVSIFGYLAMEDLADKVRNVFFICIETFLLFLIFKPELPPLPDAAALGFFIVLTLIGVILHFIITIFFGTLGFWSPDTWGPKFIFFMLIDFTAGKLFPLNILPEVLQKGIAFTPFPYFSFIQTQAFLDKLTTAQLWQHLLIISFWTIALGYITYRVWQKGIKDYSAAGQ